MNPRDLYEQNRVFAVEDWGVEMPPWDELDLEGRAAWGAAALEYTVKALLDDREEDENGN